MFDFDLKRHLSYVDANDLHEKICTFRKLPIKRLSRADIARHIGDVLCFDTPNGKRAILIGSAGSYPAGTRFYRVRALQADDTKLPLRDMRVEADAWNPPTHVVQQGRLNREGESLLYTSPMNPKVAVEEMKIPDGVNFALIVYEALDEIRVTSIGVTPDDPGLIKDEVLKQRMLIDFLAHEFTRDVGVGTEYLYNISEIIAKDYFDHPPEVQDAWCYPSIAERPSFNVCFRPEVAKCKLRLVGVQIAACVREQTNMMFHVKCIASGFDEAGIFHYHMIGSEKQRKIFPEIQLRESN